MWQESWEPGSNDSTLATNFQHIFTFYRSTRIAPVRWPRLCKELITSRSCFRFPIISMNRSPISSPIRRNPITQVGGNETCSCADNWRIRGCNLFVSSNIGFRNSLPMSCIKRVYSRGDPLVESFEYFFCWTSEAFVMKYCLLVSDVVYIKFCIKSCNSVKCKNFPVKKILDPTVSFGSS